MCVGELVTDNNDNDNDDNDSNNDRKLMITKALQPPASEPKRTKIEF